MEPDDVKRLLRKRFTPRDKCMILMLLRSGMRISESLALKLEDIDLRKRTVTIRESAKTGNARITYLSDDAYNALRKWMKARKANTKFLLYARGETNMSYSTARSSFSKCLRKAHLVRKGYTLHSLRHAFASELLCAGMPLESLQILMGHSDIEVTRRYARLTDKALEKDYFEAMKIIERGAIDGSYRSVYQI
ncbi:MAG TPA: tyrosine-type recombinase/integrase [Syntrophorhabdales bacterium]|nr:tyrosine-type recombinase/integrase [Syntrophorhabdales bacterium]